MTDTHTSRWSAVRRLLAIRLDGLGDVLMTTPALAALRHGLPAAHITLLAAPASAALAPHIADVVDEVLTWRAPWMPGTPANEPDPAADIASLQALHSGQFDAAVIFTVCTQSALPAALWCRTAGIPLRLAHARENPYALLTDWAPERDTIGQQPRHEVQRQLDLVASIGAHLAVTPERGIGSAQHPAHLHFSVHDADRQTVAERLQALGIAPGRRVVVLHPGATAASRRWPAERFGQVAHQLARDADVAVVLAGDAGDVPLVQAAQQAMPDGMRAPSLAGALRLGELAALIERAAVLVANNSLPAHLAAALGTPVVTLYALTNPQHTPWQARAAVLSHDVPCRNCLKSRCPLGHHACLAGVTTQRTTAVALALLQLGPMPMGQPSPTTTPTTARTTTTTGVTA